MTTASTLVSSPPSDEPHEHSPARHRVRRRKEQSSGSLAQSGVNEPGNEGPKHHRRHISSRNLTLEPDAEQQSEPKPGSACIPTPSSSALLSRLEALEHGRAEHLQREERLLARLEECEGQLRELRASLLNTARGANVAVPIDTAEDGPPAELKEVDLQTEERADETQKWPSAAKRPSMVARVGIVGQKTLSRLSVAAASEPPEQMELKESIWDASVLIGTEQVGRAASAYMVVLLMMNLFVQGAFAFILRSPGPGLTSKSFTRDEIDGLLAWRRNVAHDVRFFNGEMSLAARVCDGAHDLELSGQQASEYEDLSGYLSGFTDDAGSGSRGNLGMVMSCIALLTWYLTLCSETISTITYARATMSLPRGPTRISSTEECYTFERISQSRLLGSLFIVVIRAALIIVLFMYGTLFLTYTISLSDLVLNTVALEFIINVDEVIFAALAPAQIRRVLSSTAPLHLPPRKQWSGLDLQAVGLSTCVVTVLSIVVATVLVPQYEMLSDAADALCAGDLDFVATTDGIGAVSWGYPRQRGENNTRHWTLGGKNMTGRSLREIVIDGALAGYGDGGYETSCGYEKCFWLKDDGSIDRFKPLMLQQRPFPSRRVRANSVS